MQKKAIISLKSPPSVIPGVISKEFCGGRDVLCQSHVIYVDKEYPRTVPCQTPEVTSVSSSEGYSCNRLIAFFLSCNTGTIKL